MRTQGHMSGAHRAMSLNTMWHPEPHKPSAQKGKGPRRHLGLQCSLAILESRGVGQWGNAHETHRLRKTNCHLDLALSKKISSPAWLLECEEIGSHILTETRSSHIRQALRPWDWGTKLMSQAISVLPVMWHCHSLGPWGGFFLS